MKIKKIRTLRVLKGNLKKILPMKISEVIKSYENFSEQTIPDDAKGFTAHHNACKSAVVHAETLLKLARWTVIDEEVPKVSVDDGLNDLLEEAKKEYEEFEDEKY